MNPTKLDLPALESEYESLKLFLSKSGAFSTDPKFQAKNHRFAELTELIKLGKRREQLRKDLADADSATDPKLESLKIELRAVNRRLSQLLDPKHPVPPLQTTTKSTLYPTNNLAKDIGTITTDSSPQFLKTLYNSPSYAYIVAIVILALIAAPIIQTVGRTGLLANIVAFTLALTIVTATRLTLGLILKKYWAFSAIALIISTIGLGASIHFNSQQQFVNNLRNQHGCVLDNYTNYTTDVAYTECMATAVTRKASGLDNVYAICEEPDFNTPLSKYFSTKNYAGYVVSGSNKSNLTGVTCYDFYNWLKTNRKHFNDVHGYAFHVILHEAMHLTGEFNEQKTERKANSIFVDTATYFGAEQSEAERYATHYKTAVNVYNSWETSQ